MRLQAEGNRGRQDSPWAGLGAPVRSRRLALEPRIMLDAAGVTTIVNLADNGDQANADTEQVSVSDDGRYVAFATTASNLVSGDAAGKKDIFIRDTQAGTVTRITFGANGTDEADFHSYNPSISGDGRYVVYESDAENLVINDTNSFRDIFLYDTVTGTTKRVSVDSGGTESNGGSWNAVISDDGRYIAYQSAATNLVSGDTNSTEDVFLYDTVTGTTTRVSVATDGTQGATGSSGPSISDDGRYVTFTSAATNFATGDALGFNDVFVHDTQTGTTTAVSVDSDGDLGNGHSSGGMISGNGRYVVFESLATDLVTGDTNAVGDIFLHDLQTGTTTRVNVATDGSEADKAADDVSISDNGRYIAFQSEETGFVSGDTNAKADIFIRDTVSGTTTRASVATDGTQGNDNAESPMLSGDGSVLVFLSASTTLTSGDTNGKSDVFYHTTGADAQDPTVTSPTTSEDTATAVTITRNTDDGAEITHYKISDIVGGTVYSDAALTTTISDGAFVASGGATTTVWFVPTADWNSSNNGNGGFKVRAATASDGTGNLSDAAASTISVTAVADTPTVTSPSTQEETATAVTITRNADDGAEVTHFRITNIVGGTLFADSGLTTAISSGDFVASGGTTTVVYFRPSAGWTSNDEGNASFSVQAATGSSAAQLGGSVATASITVAANASSTQTTTTTATAGASDDNDTDSPARTVVPDQPVVTPTSRTVTPTPTTSSSSASDSDESELPGPQTDTFVGFGDTGPSTPGVAPVTPPGDIANVINALVQARVSPTDQVVVFQGLGADAIVAGLLRSPDPAAASVGHMLALVRQGEPVEFGDLRRLLMDQGVPPQTAMSYLAAYSVVEKAARTEILAPALAELAVNPAIAAFSDPGDDLTGEYRLPPNTTHAVLLIGVDDYQGSLRDLKTPVNDVAAIGDVLADRFGYYPVVLTNPDKQEIIAWIAAMVRQLREGSSLLVYYAGHGYAFEATGEGYWLPADAQSDSAANWISTSELSRFMGQVPSAQVMVISDSCFSGAFTSEQQVSTIAADLSDRRAVTVLASGGDTPVTDEGFGGHSIFAGYLLQTLEQTSGSELGHTIHEHVRDDVSRSVPQVPTYGALVSAGHQQGADFVIGGR